MNATITVLPGDGIGPEVMVEALKVLKAVAAAGGHRFAFHEAPIGGNAIDVYGTALPDETLRQARAGDAVLLAAVGGPKWDDPAAKVRPEQGLLKIRKELGLFANIRPVKVTPFLAQSSPLRPEIVEGTDIVVIRELTGGLYFGPRKEGGEADAEPAAVPAALKARFPKSRYAYDTELYFEAEVERVVRLAAEMARARRKKLTSVDKANVLATGRLWRQVASRVMREEFPDIEVEHILVDAAAMHLIRRPTTFDVMVTSNMFGDILTDEASQIAGSMGLLPSASLGAPGTPGLYEPIHGSAPDIAGRGIANPLAMILSAAMMLRHSLGLAGEAAAVERAVAAVLAAGYRTPDLARPGETTVTTAGMGDAVVAALQPQVAGSWEH
ncbi:MAG: 3-isopropylmalate dehydrogenase [Ardenticatenaceae bacterium]|nr:3-isopropylmalate dehydrogenase [Ardenticatenaceae bacterium]